MTTEEKPKETFRREELVRVVAEAPIDLEHHLERMDQPASAIATQASELQSVTYDYGVRFKSPTMSKVREAGKTILHIIGQFEPYEIVNTERGIQDWMLDEDQPICFFEYDLTFQTDSLKGTISYKKRELPISMRLQTGVLVAGAASTIAGTAMQNIPEAIVGLVTVGASIYTLVIRDTNGKLYRPSNMTLSLEPRAPITDPDNLARLENLTHRLETLTVDDHNGKFYDYNSGILYLKKKT